MKKMMVILLSAAMIAGLSMPAMAETTEQTPQEPETATEYSAEETETLTDLSGEETVYEAPQLEGKEAATSGKFGKDFTLTWQVTGDKETGYILTIDGTGDMPDLSGDSAGTLWLTYRSDIVSVKIGDGVTSIGEYSFAGCSRLTSAEISDNVTSIGAYAFANTGLSEITVMNPAAEIGENALGMKYSEADGEYVPVSEFVITGYTDSTAETYADANGLTFNGVSISDVVKEADGIWYYEEYGVPVLSYNGFADNVNGTWFIRSGKVAFSVTGVVKGMYNGESKWGNVVNGKLQKQETVAKNSNGWWYIAPDGFVDFTKNTVAKNSNGWWAVFNGKVNFSYNGIATNQNGSFKITNGKVTFADNGVIKVGSTWYYLVKSKVTPGPTVQKNSAGWWYIDENGKVDFTYNGFAANTSGIWYIQNGKVNFGANGVLKSAANGKWGYVKGGKLQTGNVTVGMNSNGCWYIGKDGYVDFTYNGTVAYNGTNCNVTNGFVTYTGWCKSGNAYYYAKDGKPAANTVIDGYKTNASGYSKTKTLVMSIVGSITNSAMSNDGKIKACWNYVVTNNWTYTRTYEHVAKSWVWYNGWTDDFAYDVLAKHTGNCFRYAAGFAYLVKEATDLPVVVYHGQTPAASGGVTPHGWTTVYLNGTWYAYDPDLYKFGKTHNLTLYYRYPYATSKNSIHLYGVGTKIN